MPLYENARALIRANFEALQRGKRAQLITAGRLTNAQLESLNKKRAAHGYPPIDAEVVFLGQHIYNSRIAADGYTIEDVLDQLASGMDARAVVLDTSPMTALENPNARADRYGNLVRDRIVLECSLRHPKPEIFSVIPKGDRSRPAKRPLT